MINVSYVRQGEHSASATRSCMARDLVGDEPFAVLLGDDIIDAAVPCMRQMMDVFESYGGPVIAVQRCRGRDLRLRRHRGRREGDSGRSSASATWWRSRARTRRPTWPSSGATS